MDYTLAVLLSLLQLSTMCTAVPLPVEPEDVVKMKSKVKRIAEQLVVRLEKDFQFPAGRTLSPAAAEDLDGLSSTLMVLDGYNSLISDSLSGVSQIKSDISSLTGYLDQWRQKHCSEQEPKPSLPEPLQRLQSQKEFIHTVSFEALMRVKEFLNLLLKTLDQNQHLRC